MKINKKGIGQAMLHILLCVLLLVWLYPIIFAICNSFKVLSRKTSHFGVSYSKLLSDMKRNVTVGIDILLQR